MYLVRYTVWVLLPKTSQDTDIAGYRWRTSTGTKLLSASASAMIDDTVIQSRLYTIPGTSTRLDYVVKCTRYSRFPSFSTLDCLYCSRTMRLRLLHSDDGTLTLAMSYSTIPGTRSYCTWYEV